MPIRKRGSLDVRANLAADPSLFSARKPLFSHLKTEGEETVGGISRRSHLLCSMGEIPLQKTKEIKRDHSEQAIFRSEHNCMHNS